MGKPGRTLLAKIWTSTSLRVSVMTPICSMSIVICCTISAGRAGCSTSRAASLVSQSGTDLRDAGSRDFYSARTSWREQDRAGTAGGAEDRDISRWH